MKKFSFAALAIVTICTFRLSAQGIEVAAGAKSGFNTEFKNADNVIWEKVNGEVFLARFNENNVSKLAYFDSDGKLLTQGRKISFANSPQHVQKSVNRIIESYRAKNGILQVVHTYEITDQDATHYYLNVGNTSLQLALMLSSGGSCQVLKKVELTPISNTSVLANNN